MKYRLVHLLAGSALLFCAACATAQSTDAAPDTAPADSAIPRFTISRYDVSGDTLLGPELVQSLVTPFTGPARDFGDIQRAVEALENAYRARGYTMVLVGLPEQELDRGAVRLNVVQTQVAKVAIKGNHYFDDANVRRALPTLLEGSTPNMPALGLSLKLANENPARRIEVSLATGDTDGVVDATVSVADERAWKAMLSTIPAAMTRARPMWG